MVHTQKQIQDLYHKDYHLWLETTIKQLNSRSFSNLDLENLIEELEGMNRSDKRAVTSLLTRLLEHLLKLIYWEEERDYNTNKWQSEIITFRIQIKKLLKDSPSLKPYLVDIFEECYVDARKVVSRLINKPIDFFSVEPPATLEEILKEDWFPDA